MNEQLTLFDWPYISIERDMFNTWRVGIFIYDYFGKGEVYLNSWIEIPTKEAAEKVAKDFMDKWYGEQTFL